MTGEKPTNSALQPAWQNAPKREESTQEPRRCRIVVIGIGEAGNNAVTQLVKTGTKNIYTVAINTDALHLNKTCADKKILIGRRLTRGESCRKIEKNLREVDIVFVTASLDSRAATGAAPIVAEIARKNGATTIGVVTKSMQLENRQARKALQTLSKLRQACHTVIVIDNKELMELPPQTNMEVSQIIDRALANTIKEIIDTISAPSLIDLNPADFRTIVEQGGAAAVGIGLSNASNRAEEAVQNALKSQMSNIDYTAAASAMVYVTGNSQMSVEEASRAAEIVTKMMNTQAKVIWGAGVNPELGGKLKVTLLMTGINPPTPMNRGLLSSATTRLFNLEPHSEPERKLPIDLNLYQLEDF